MDKIFRKSITIKRPTLSGSKIVGEAFLKSLSIVVRYGIKFPFYEGNCSASVANFT